MAASYQIEVKAATWKEIVTEKSLRTPTLLVLVLMYFQAFTGFDCILFFSKSLFLVSFLNVNNLILRYVISRFLSISYIIISEINFLSESEICWPSTYSGCAFHGSDSSVVPYY